MKTIRNKKRVGALLLAVAMVCSLFSSEMVGFVWADTGDALCMDCNQQPCVCIAPAVVCEDCGQEPCVCTAATVVCEDCGQEPCVCVLVNVCETCGQEPCVCVPVNVCETCKQEPCVCVPVTVCETCKQEPCVCVPVAVCETCKQEPCVCVPVAVCETCGQEPCVCVPVIVCETCGQEPCVCAPVNVCETCNQEPCVCAPAVACETCGKAPCVCVPVVVCETCGQEPCVCAPVAVCKTCKQEPCVCVPVIVCETCGQVPCVCLTAVCEYCGIQLIEGVQHTADCFSHCSCDYIDNIHQQGCALYVKVCTCDPAANEGEPHLEGCPFYDPANARCEECGNSVNNHSSDCSNAKPESITITQNVAGTRIQVTAQGQTLEGVTLKASVYDVQSYAALKEKIVDYLRTDEEVAFGYDISLELDGEEYQPAKGESVIVTVEVPQFVLNALGYASVETLKEDLTLYHIHEGVAEELVLQDTPGMLSFEVENFSTFVGTVAAASTLDLYTQLTDAIDIADFTRVLSSATEADARALTGTQIDMLLAKVEALGGDPETETILVDLRDQGIWNGVFADGYRVLTEQGGALGKGNYRLSRDLKMIQPSGATYDFLTTGKVVIDLNGYVLEGSGKGCLFDNDGKLTIKDSQPKTGPHYFRKTTAESKQPWELVKTGDTSNCVEVYGGIVTGGRDLTPYNNGNGGGGAVRMPSVGADNTTYTFTLEGGTIIGNSSTRCGGAVYGGVSYMNGGSVMGNYGARYTGGFSLSGKFELNGGYIGDNNSNPDDKYNTTTNEQEFYDNAQVIIGGSSQFTMTGGSIEGNVSTVSYTSSKKFLDFYFSGGEINGDFRLLNELKAYISGGTINGSIFMYQGTCNVSDSAVIQGGNRMDGGGVCIRSGTFNMSGGTIQNCEATLGGAVYMGRTSIPSDMKSVQAVFNMTGGTIRNCNAEIGGAVYMDMAEKAGVTTTVRFVMSEGQISGNTAEKHGGAVYLSKGTFSLSGQGSISENSAQQNGGGAYLAGGQMNISGGSIFSNVAIQNGGGTYLADGELNISGGAITGNTATQNGGGAYVIGGDVNMTDGTLQQNEATVNGGGVYLNTGTFNMTSGTLLQNAAIKDGGGVYLNNGNLSLKGTNAKIQGNSAVNGAGVYLVGGIPGLYEGTLSSNMATENGGGIYIDKQEVKLQPTGKVLLQGNKARNGAGIYINGTAVAEGQPPNAGFTVLECEGTVELDGNTATQAGGGVCVNNGYFTMQYDNIRMVNNKAANGGGVAVLSGVFAMAQGNVGETDNANTAVNGGGVYVSGGSAVINGGTVQYNIATGNGGGVAVDGGSAAIDGGTIQRNKATGSGGGVSVSGGSVTIDSGTVQDNSATIGGGASVSGGTTSAAVINGGTVQNNTATDMGGGVAVSGGSATINGGTVKTNTATNMGGGVAVSGGSAIINGGIVQSNTAPMGGGIYVSGGNLTLSGGDITGNTAATHGGGFYVSDGNFEMEPRKQNGVKLISTISNNYASYGGGGYVNGGNVIVIEGDIENNRATNDGGGIYVTTSSTDVSVTMLSGHLQENKAETGNGGGMAVVNNSITGNTIVKVGCLMNHDLDGDGVFSHQPKFEYEGNVTYDQYKPHTHDYCPIVYKNEAKKNGGGFYLSGDNSNLSFYCIEESGNMAENNTNCYSLDVEGGQVEIGDAEYHNCNNMYASHPTVWGYVDFNSTILVTGGDVNIYGDMDNPIFKEQITVDIKLSGGSFTDHRREKSDSKDAPRYKVHYVENFPESEGYRTGLYTVDQVTAVKNKETDKFECWIEIPSSNFSHPGFKITGWFTHPDGAGTHADGKTGYEYEVSKKYNLCDNNLLGMGTDTTCTEECCNDGDSKILKLYAQWERKGYLIVFNSNQPTGAKVTGEMAKQKCSQDISYHLNPNAYQCLGYVFRGWAKNHNASEIDYADEAEVLNLTMEDSKEVNLYALWEECEHEDVDLEYTVNGKTLTETCEKCKITYGSGRVEYEHEAVASVQGRTEDYTGDPYPARLTVDADWLGADPEIIYVKQHDANWDDENDGVYQKWGEPGDTDAPIHAGIYEAKISVSGQTVFDGDTASDNVVIERVQWPTPEAPQLTYDLVKKKVTITSPLASVVDGVSYVYQYNCPELNGSTWVSQTEYTNINEFNKFYYFKAQQVEDRNHTTSKASEASVFLSENGSSVVYFILDEGAMREIVTQEGIANQMDFKVGTLPDYHKRGWTVTIDAQKDGTSVDTAYTQVGDTYTLPDLKAADAFIVTVKGTAKNAVAAAITENGQVFDGIIDQPVSISQDSAFTIQYSITDYRPDEYESQSLAFSQPLPQNTKLIMVTKAKETKLPQYWYYVVEAEAGESTLPLDQFQSMGSGGANYSYPTDSEKTDYTQRFVVDFSQASSKPTTGTLTLTYHLVKSEKVTIGGVEYDCFAPNISLGKENTLKEAASFTLSGTSESENGAASVTYKYDPSSGHASIWEGRNSALVFMLTYDQANGQSKPELPADLKLVVSGDAPTAEYALQEGDKFILPLGDLNKLTDATTLQLSLKSNLFTAADTLSFDVEWYVSATTASSAPMEGSVVKDGVTITLSASKTTGPSLLITGNPQTKAEQRLAIVGGTLTTWVTRANTEGLTIRARLLREKEIEYDTHTALEYVDTLYKQDLFVNAGADITQERCTVSLIGQQPGNFCLHVVAIEGEGENQVYKAEAKYYFIVEAATSEEGTNSSGGSDNSGSINDTGEAESSISTTGNE